jgi:hypothetical protein
MYLSSLSVKPIMANPHPLNRTRARTSWGLAAGCLLASTLAGCSGEARVPVHPVAGKVSFNGQVPEGAQVVLHPRGHTLPPDVVAQGIVRNDGSFKVGVYQADDGAPPGDYVATVQWFKVVASEGGGGRGPNVIPKTYSDPATSPIQVSVKEGANSLPPIEIKQ